MTTTRTILFDSPFLLGFDHTRALIDRAAKAAAESYPPYNVEQIGDASVAQRDIGLERLVPGAVDHGAATHHPDDHG